MQITNCYILNVRKIVNKKIKFETTISVAKTNIQVAIKEGVMSELTEIYTSLSISNPEYYKPRGHPSKHLKSLAEKSNVQQISSSSKTCSYCLEKGHNIRECK
ncbi:6361_t:CDS:2 [Cetraspora pellucida]|uniref:6361_t:CDS:1 n=1 Tax=Cetraspora pellucida TaxID=1433469 RepID=A0A9N9FCR1_9GLOM|nr:6361_t:CDS:2 [Cetraspora pellucida]